MKIFDGHADIWFDVLQKEEWRRTYCKKISP